MIGLALTKHQRVGIFRKEGTELTAIVDRIAAIQGSRDGYNGSDKIWRIARQDGKPLQIELGSFPNPGDEAKYQGRPHDLLGFDEAQNMREGQVRFLLGWLRSTDPEQRCRAILTFNPPTTVPGRWIIAYFAPWLDDKHPNPAEPGELRWFAALDGKEVECDDGETFEHNGETIYPLSRTFIPSRIADNPYLASTGYMAQLQALPEPLRSQMLYGDFKAGVEDDPFQVCPTAWVEAAMRRWTEPLRYPEMESVGVDVAMKGRDKTIIARRHGMWFDKPITYSGTECKDGPTIAGFIMASLRDRAVIHIDLFGVGAQPYGHLMKHNQQVIGVNVGDPAGGFDQSGTLGYFNLRSEMWWTMREALDPANNTGIVLPPDQRLLADLCAPTWKPHGAKIKVASRDEIVALIGRSPDFGSAYVLALMDTPREHVVANLMRGANKTRDFDPYDLEGAEQRTDRIADFDPYRGH